MAYTSPSMSQRTAPAFDGLETGFDHPTALDSSGSSPTSLVAERQVTLIDLMSLCHASTLPQIRESQFSRSRGARRILDPGDIFYAEAREEDTLIRPRGKKTINDIRGSIRSLRCSNDTVSSESTEAIWSTPSRGETQGRN